MILTSAFNKIAALDKRIRVVQGGSSASKTYSIIQKLTLQAVHAKDTKLISIVTDTHPNIEKGAYRDFEAILESLGLSVKGTKNPIEAHINKWTFEFFGLDDERKARGGRRDILFINEANRIKWETARQLIMRTREIVYLDYNPDAEFWAHEKYIGNSDVDFITVNYKDNEACPQTAIDEIEKYKDIDKEWYKVYGLGLVGDLFKGKVFPTWEQIDNFPDIDGYWYGLDFGYSVDPTGIIKVLPVKDRIYTDEMLYEIGLTNPQIAKRIKEFPGGYHGEPVICDSAEPKSIQELRNHGINAVPADKGPGSVNEGIDFLKTKKILVTRWSTNLIKENKNYKWKMDRDGNVLKVPVDSWNHLIDPLRYAFSLNRERKNRNESLFVKY